MVWFGRVALLVILIFCRELLFVCNQKSRHSRRRAARGVLASFSWGSFSIFFSIFGLVARAFHSTFSTSAANLMQEAITGATATIIYGLRIKPDSYSVWQWGCYRSRTVCHCALPRFYFLSCLFPPCFAPVLERVEEEPRAVFLHLFRGGHFLSFSAFSGWLLELFTVPFRRVQRILCKRRSRAQPQQSSMG